ncbi:hypothetical protein GIB67_021067 [Kingdonia uniflora]|uniref:Ubiquitin carboxyl-terminal hydrolase n=1 Tax=Kingdonia uniflora TaxID=39325 RepID=A0A7J7N7N7_9MAGN|nr:hypothetical protein GIB67_021067 [Kingdonia uniflora]
MLSKLDFDSDCNYFCLSTIVVGSPTKIIPFIYLLVNHVNICFFPYQILVEVLGEINDTSLAEASRAVVDNGFSEKELTSVLAVPNMSKGGVSRNSSSELASSVKEVDNSYGISGVVTRGVAAGLTGLLNLGNTCFMNSAIQCLVHTPEFARYFREDYHPDINVRNPLGMEGKLALAFGELLRKLWAPGRTPIAPRPFKANLARFAPQFSGYNQHDSQELLAFLLDGLHEDLNRVKDRPYVESRDANGRPDEEVADEYWANHIARNDSIIVDVCQGQYKSTLVCPVCGKFSVTFDPFMYLSLPLQTTNTRTMTVMVFTSDGSARPTPCTVTVPKQGRIRELVQSISNSCSLKFSEKVLLAEIRDHSVNRFLEDPLVLLTFIKDEDQIAAYKIQKFEKGTIFFQLVHRREENSYHDAVPWKPFGIPLVSAISRDNVITRGDVHAIVRTMLSSLERSETLEPSNFLNTRISDTPVDKPRDVSSNEALNSNLSDSMDINHSSKIASPPKLPLNLVDENNICIDLSVGEEKTIKVPPSSTSVLVFIDWSKELLEKYETDFLEYLPEVFRYGHAKKARAEPLSLYTCLDAFLREEPLVPEDMWYCPQCKEQRQASKKLDLWRLPEVLVIHLKRFSYSRSMKHKLETYVNFPIHDFDLTNYVAHTNSSKRQLYELYALSNHFGGMGSGHYTANIKLLDENKWFNFDDSHISTMNEEDVKSAAAYVLFYRRAKSEDVSLNNGAQSSAGHNNIVSSKK